MNKFDVVMTTLVSLGLCLGLGITVVGAQVNFQPVVNEMTNRQLSEKVVGLESRINRLEFDNAIYDLRISDLETALSVIKNTAQARAKASQPPQQSDPLWGLLQPGMTEVEVQSLIGNPSGVGGGDSWNRWNYRSAGKVWKQWNYSNGGYVIFTKPKRTKQFGLQIPDLAECHLEEWLIPIP